MLKTARLTGLAAVGLLCGASAGCAAGHATADPIGTADLQRGITERLVQAGTPSKSVNCRDELGGQVGDTTRCEVLFTPGDSVEALLTTTGIADGTAIWEITGPSMTRDQLIARLAAQDPSKKVACDSGLAGVVGEWTQCQIFAGGAALNRTVEVRAVKVLTMDLGVTETLPRQRAEDLLMQKIKSDGGGNPESAACIGDLAATVGSTVQCAVVAGGDPDDYLLTVTAVSPGAVDFDYKKVTPDGF